MRPLKAPSRNIASTREWSWIGSTARLSRLPKIRSSPSWRASGFVVFGLPAWFFEFLKQAEKVSLNKSCNDDISVRFMYWPTLSNTSEKTTVVFKQNFILQALGKHSLTTNCCVRDTFSKVSPIWCASQLDQVGKKKQPSPELDGSHSRGIPKVLTSSTTCWFFTETGDWNVHPQNYSI